MSAKSCKLAIGCWMLLVLAPAAMGETTWHVDDDSCPEPGSGSQGDPFCSIQRGIDESVSGDEIVVAPGTYNEKINFNGKAIRLRSSDGPDVTIIDGGGPGHPVVRCVSGEGPDTTLEGFTVTGGLAPVFGGGMSIEDSSPTVVDCVFRENRTRGSGPPKCGGAGMFILRGSPTVSRCQFITNKTGALFDSCPGIGGGIFIFSANPTVSECTFVGNTGREAGGGIFIVDSDRAIVTHCVFVANTADGGGAMTMLDSSPVISNCTFKNNVARQGAGIFNFLSSRPTIINCVFSGNTADERSGAIHNIFGSMPMIINSTFSGNVAGNSGGAMYSDMSTPFVSNSIVWGNAPDQIVDAANSLTTITYSDVEGGWTGSGSNNIDADPLFVDPDGPDNTIGTEDDDLRLLPGSPAIDAGDNTAVPSDTADLDGDGDTSEQTPFDLDGNPRLVDDAATPDTGNGAPPIVDMGAHEFRGPAIPAVSGWGLTVMLLAALTAGTILFRRRRVHESVHHPGAGFFAPMGALLAAVLNVSVASGQVQVGPQIRIDVNGGTAPANETSIASSNFGPSEIVAAWNDQRDAGGVRIGVGVSSDGRAGRASRSASRCPDPPPPDGPPPAGRLASRSSWGRCRCRIRPLGPSR